MGQRLQILYKFDDSTENNFLRWTPKYTQNEMHQYEA